MKTFKTLLLLTTTLAVSACAQLKQVTQGPVINAIDNTVALPTGTYFITNAGGGALTPLNPGVGENVFLRPFTKSGVQKWHVTQHKTTKGVLTYTISLEGSDNLFFQPYAVKDHTPVISPRGSGTSFKIIAAGSPKVWYIKSMLYNGDALRSFVYSPNLPTEIRFEAAENTDKFMWKFVATEEN